MTTDPEKCPLCGKANTCGLATGCGTIEACWCRGFELSQVLRDRVGADRQGEACICEACLGKLRAAELAARED
jgi:hypothetical protein